MLNVDATITLDESADDNAQHRLQRLQRQLAGLPGLQTAARRKNDREVLGQLKAREAKLVEEIDDARIALARSDVDEATRRLRVAESTVEPARVKVMKAASAFESASAELVRRRSESDSAYSHFTSTQQAVTDASRRLADAEDKLNHLLDDDAPPPPTPAPAVGHQRADVLPQRGLGSWDRSFIGCRRDE